jgi:HAD superfamily hydrolase (TIGR01509 family)|tara:strand:+ start:1328 stop:1906 length:579 start_codon:yes stop_codon:yes gene_type:complete
MMKDKVILTDCDGVLVDWVHGFVKWMKVKGYDPVVSDTYDMEIMFDMTRAETKKLVISFNESAEMRYLSPLRDAIKYVRKLHEEHGYVFRCITSMSLNKAAYRLRKQNLDQLFGPTVFEELVCLDTGADKDEALEQYRGSDMYWVEDKPQNADLGVALGLDSLLISHTFNAAYAGRATRVQNWKEIYNIITG